jgi:hypothetical protein
MRIEDSVNFILAHGVIFLPIDPDLQTGQGFSVQAVYDCRAGDDRSFMYMIWSDTPSLFAPGWAMLIISIKK